jgi:hypothetical protein
MGKILLLWRQSLSLSMYASFLLLSFLFILVTALFFKNNYSADTAIFAQFQNGSLPLLGVNITSPHRGQQIPVNINDLTISGKSTDKPDTDDCQVSLIVNDVKPYQPTTANGTTGENNDYSKWSFTLNSSYTSIREGVNKITSKLSCLPNVVGNTNNITKWYSINVTGIAIAETNNSTVSTPSPPASSSPSADSDVSPEFERNQRLDSDVKEEQDTSERIGEEIGNLKDRILEEVEENLRKEGIELNLR